MIDVDKSHLNVWCAPASNPLTGASVLHPSAEDRSVEIVWHLTQYELPIGLYVVKAKWERCQANWKGTGSFRITFSQGAFKKKMRVDIGSALDGSYAFNIQSHEGAVEISIHYEISSECEFASSGLHFSPLVFNRLEDHDNLRLFRFIEPPKLSSDAKPRRSYIVSANQGGLINRLNSVLSVIYVSRRIERDALILWGANTHCAADLEHIFETAKSFESIDIYDHDFSSFSTFYNYSGENIPLDTTIDGRNIIVHTIEPFATVPTINYSLSELAEIFSSLKLSTAIREMMSAFAGLDFSRTMGFHLRRPFPGTEFAALENAKFATPLDKIETFIGDLLSSSPQFDRLLLCANDLQAERRMIEKFGEKIMVFPKSSIDNTSSFRAVQE
ncbi:hypothetical protein, partial [Heyndrickxia sporothermodurans]